MRVKDIKTREQFYEFGDVWYQRTHNLRRAYQDDSRSDAQRIKAFNLWNIMFKRVLILSNIYAKISQPKPPSYNK